MCGICMTPHWEGRRAFESIEGTMDISVVLHAVQPMPSILVLQVEAIS